MSEQAHTIPDHVAARVARLVNEAEDMRKQATDDLKKIYADLREELRGMGWLGSVVSVEVAALKGAIAEIRMDKEAKTKREEKGERVDDYVSMLSRARAREGQSYAEVKGVHTAHTPSPRKITEQEQPEEPATTFPASHSQEVTGGDLSEPSSDAGKRGRADEQSGIGRAKSEQAAHSNSPSAAPAVEPEAAPQAPRSVSGEISDADVPAFLKKDRAPVDKPNCLKLKDGHCKIGFPTAALCADCNAARAKAVAA